MRRAAVILVVFIGACGGGGSVNQKCVTGASVACACTDGRMGAQLCRADGTFGACICGGGAGGAGGGGRGGAGGLTGWDGGVASGGGSDGGAIDTGPPVSGTGSRMIAPGNALLVGGGFSSCTNQLPAAGDRWCAFATPSLTFMGFVELWVINVSRAAAGATVRCDGNDTGCLRLTTSLFVDPSNGLGIHGFDGDTLFYYAETGPLAAQSTGFVGPVYAWRPGWAGGRKLTGDTGVACFGHARATVAVCFDNPDEVTIPGQLSYDMHVGALPAADGAPLPKVETVLFATASDAMGVRKFEFDFSPDGAHMAWSARPTAVGVETLKVLRLGDAAPATVAADVSRWRISPDGGTWYWLKTFNYNVTGAPSGTLQAAPFPAGTSPAMLAANVGEFDLAGSRGVIYRDGLVGNVGALKVIADRASPTPVTLDTGVIGVADVSDDGTRAIYARTGDAMLGTVDLHVATAGTPGRCTLVTTPTAAPVGAFLASGGGAAWANFDTTTGQASGMFTNTATCASAKYATDILSWTPVADLGFVYGDDAPTGADLTLRASRVTSGALPAGAVLQTHADTVYSTLLPTLNVVVYTVYANSPQDGVYINDALPF